MLLVSLVDRDPDTNEVNEIEAVSGGRLVALLLSSRGDRWRQSKSSDVA